MGRVYKDSKSDCYYLDYLDRRGKRVRKSSGFRDKKNAETLLRKLETAEREVRVGLAVDDSKADQKPITEHLRDYANSKANDAGDNHIATTERLITRIVDYNKWEKLKEIDSDGIEAFLTSLRDAGRSPRNLSAHVTAIRSFCRWCVKRGRLNSDPTFSVSKPSSKTDRRIRRRMLLHDEWQQLRKLLLGRTAPSRNGQTARERMVMYWLAIESGLRSKELRELRAGNLVLDSSEPHVVASASTTKNAKLAKQYISDALANELAEITRRKTPGAKVFHVEDRTQMAKVLRRDAEDAEIVTTNDAGEVLDFHALRHTTGAWLVQAGVTLPEVQAIMRHSTITLTIDAYGHLAPDAASRHRNLLNSMVS